MDCPLASITASLSARRARIKTIVPFFIVMGYYNLIKVYFLMWNYGTRNKELLGQIFKGCFNEYVYEVEYHQKNFYRFVT